MNHEYMISIVRRAGVPYEPEPTKQVQYSQVRFLYRPTNRSLNLGYRSTKDVFVADFVFKAKETAAQNRADLNAFLGLFGGEVGKRSTPFARLEPTVSQEDWLIDVIRAYWAMGCCLPGTHVLD